MKIRTQFTLLLSFFGLLLLAMAIFLAFTSQQVDHLLKQEEIARRIEQGVNNLSYIAGDYVMYGEDQQRKRWEAEFNALANDVSGLAPSDLEQQSIVSHIKDDQARLQAVFTEVAETIEKSTQSSQTTAISPAFMQVAWSRMEVQNQSMAFEAALLSKKLRVQADQLKQMNLILMFALTGIFGISLISNSFLIRRRILRSISELHAGAMIVGSGNLDFTILVRRNDEIGELSRAFNQMTTDLKQVTASKSDLEREIEVRKQAEDRIRRQEQELRLVMDTVPALISHIGKDFGYVRVNKSYEDWFGLGQKDVEGRFVWEVIGEAAWNLSRKHLERAMSGEVVSYEEKMPYQRGGHRWVSTTLVPNSDENGIVQGIVALVVDITERKQAEEALLDTNEELQAVTEELRLQNEELRQARFALEESEKRLKFVMNACHIGSWELDIEKQIIVRSPEHDRLYGYSIPQNEWTYERWFKHIVPEDCDRVEASIQQSIQTQENWDCEFRILGPDGQVRWIWVLGSQRRGADGVERRMAGVVQDVTVRRQAEETVQKNEAMLRAILEQMPSGVTVRDAFTGALVLSNARSETLLGDLVNIPRQFIHLDGRGYESEEWPVFRSMARGEVVEAEEIERERIDGSQITLSVSSAPIRNAQGRIIMGVGIYHDITERKRVEDALHQSKATLLSFYDSAPFMMGITELDGDRTVAVSGNRTAAEFFGVHLTELPGKTGLELGNPVEFEKLWIESYRSAQQDGAPAHFEYEYPRADGTCWISATVAFIEISSTGRPRFSYVMEDVTRRKQVEAALRESEARRLAAEAIRAERDRLYNVLEKLPAYTVLLSPDYHVPFANRFFRERFGEFVGARCCYEHLFNRTEPCEICETYRVLKTNAPHHWEWMGPDERNYDVYDFPFTDSDGSLLIFEMGIDVTEMKRAQAALQQANETLEQRVEERTAALRESEERYRGIVETAEEGIATHEPDGTITYINRRMADMLGYLPEEVIGRSSLDFVDDDEKEAVIHARERVKEQGSFSRERKLYRKDGSILWTLSNISPRRDKAGNFIGYLAMHTDITARKQTEDALKKSEKRYRELVQYAPAGIYEIDFRSRRFVSVNDAMCQMSGYTCEELLGMEPLTILDQDSQKLFMQRLQMWLEGNPPQENVEYEVVRKDGSKIDVLLNVTFTRDVHGVPLGASVIGYDITERKKAERNLELVNRTLKALSNSNQAMMRAESEADLLNKVCRIIVEDCSYALVWVGYAENDEEKSVRPVASAGFEEGYLETLKITWADTERGRGPTGTSIRTGKTSRCRNMLTDPQFAPWREQALERGYASSMVVPLLQGDKPFGAITIYAREPDAFSDEEEKLLTKLAGDLTYGIQTIRLREALRQSEEKYRNLFESMTEEVHFWRLVRDEGGCIETWRLVDANPPALKSWGWATVAEIQGKTTEEIFGPGATEHYMPVVQRIMSEGVSYSYEDYFPNLDKYFRFTSVPLGEHFITTGADITAIKKAEQALRSAFAELEQRMAELQTLMDIAPVAIAIGHDPQGKEITANQLLSKWLDAPVGVNVSFGTPKEQRTLDFQVFRNGQLVCIEDLPIQYAAINGRKVQNDELTLVRSDGVTIEMLANAEPLFDADGQVRGSIAAYMDITERKRVENELRAARDELEERVRERTAELERRNIELQILGSAEHEQRQLAEALVKAALILNNSLNQDEVLQHILEQIREVIPYQFASIALLDGEAFYDASYQGTLDSSETQYGLKRRFHLKDFPVLKKMCQTGQPIFMPDTSQDADWVAADNLKWSRSFLAAPLLVEKRVIGFVHLFSAQPFFFTEAMCSSLVAFAAHASVAIQNAWLFERVRSGSERLQSLSRRLVEIQESERLYIARELHDEAGQMLTSLIVHLRVLEKDASQPELVLKKVSEMEASLNDVFDSLHRIAMALRPATLDHLGLVAALHQYVESVGEKHNLKVSFISEKLRERLSSNVETVLYRIVQEALTNVVRHSHATQVDVVLTVRDNKLITIIEDNGVGFDPEAISDGGHLGLFGMRERIEMVEGKLIIESAPGKGTTVMVEVEI